MSMISIYLHEVKKINNKINSYLFNPIASFIRIFNMLFYKNNNSSNNFIFFKYLNDKNDDDDYPLVHNDFVTSLHESDDEYDDDDIIEYEFNDDSIE